jgi:3-deoxy-7-phosphoheptulonate synthase
MLTSHAISQSQLRLNRDMQTVRQLRYTHHNSINDEDAWSPSSWRDYTINQQPSYPDPAKVTEIVRQLTQRQPLVPFTEIIALKKKLQAVYREGGFVFQIGDCVEMFHRADSQTTVKTLRFFAQAVHDMQAQLTVPVLTMGRLAGQFAKPRTSLTEMIDGVSLPSFHGEIINGFEPTQRTPDPLRMLKAYDICQDLLNDMHRYSYPPLVLGENFFTQHEAYLLPFEEGLCRRNPQDNHWYATSAHAVWIGNLTTGPETAHTHFARGLANPVGVKLGIDITAEALQTVLSHLNAKQRPGQVMLIPRLGIKHIVRQLPLLIRAVGDAPVLWVLDPMHGNTVRSNKGMKTRRFSDIIEEVQTFYHMMLAYGVRPHGIHCEITSEDVTECLDPEHSVTEETLLDHYSTGCDPRLNARQFMTLVKQCGDLWRL